MDFFFVSRLVIQEETDVLHVGHRHLDLKRLIFQLLFCLRAVAKGFA
jgi:hypothetical protein